MVSKLGREEKIKTNPSASCFLIPLFLKEGRGEILCKKEMQRDKSPRFSF
jgi:hypothetical protein